MEAEGITQAQFVRRNSCKLGLFVYWENLRIKGESYETSKADASLRRSLGPTGGALREQHKKLK